MRFSQFSETVSLLRNVNPDLMVYDFFIIILCKCASKLNFTSGQILMRVQNHVITHLQRL